MSKLNSIFVSIAILLCSSAFADEQFPVSGAGALSCEKWLGRQSKKDQIVDLMFASWLQGFLSGMNTQHHIQSNEKMALIPDASLLLAYINKSCSDRPSSDVLAHAIRLYQEIQPQ